MCEYLKAQVAEVVMWLSSHEEHGKTDQDNERRAQIMALVTVFCRCIPHLILLRQGCVKNGQHPGIESAKKLDAAYTAYIQAHHNDRNATVDKRGETAEGLQSCLKNASTRFCELVCGQ